MLCARSASQTYNHLIKTPMKQLKPIPYEEFSFHVTFRSGIMPSNFYSSRIFLRAQTVLPLLLTAALPLTFS